MNLPMIHPNLYLGSLEDSKKFHDGATVCVAGRSTIKQARPTYYVELDDDPQINPKQFMKKMIVSAQQINEALKLFPKVMVHCYAGINRSVSAICVYSALTGRGSVDDIIFYIRRENAAKRGLPALTNATFENIIRTLDRR